MIEPLVGRGDAARRWVPPEARRAVVARPGVGFADEDGDVEGQVLPGLRGELDLGPVLADAAADDRREPSRAVGEQVLRLDARDRPVINGSLEERSALDKGKSAEKGVAYVWRESERRGYDFRHGGRCH